jgi:hypothetical protein
MNLQETLAGIPCQHGMTGFTVIPASMFMQYVPTQEYLF